MCIVKTTQSSYTFNRRSTSRYVHQRKHSLLIISKCVCCEVNAAYTGLAWARPYVCKWCVRVCCWCRPVGVVVGVECGLWTEGHVWYGWRSVFWCVVFTWSPADQSVVAAWLGHVWLGGLKSVVVLCVCVIVCVNVCRVERWWCLGSSYYFCIASLWGEHISRGMWVGCTIQSVVVGFGCAMLRICCILCMCEFNLGISHYICNWNCLNIFY